MSTDREVDNPSEVAITASDSFDTLCEHLSPTLVCRETLSQPGQTLILFLLGSIGLNTATGYQLFLSVSPLCCLRTFVHVHVQSGISRVQVRRALQV